MTRPTAWNRVSRSNPCPVCGRADWCLIAADKTACICSRTESGKRAGDAGWVHVLSDPPASRRNGPRVFRVSTREPLRDLTPLALRYQRAAEPARFEGLARSLGLPPDALAAFGVGWSADHLAWSFPMTDPTTGHVIGIRLRRPDGSKFAVKGGKDGLFLPRDRGPDRADDSSDLLLVTEGATDAIAAYGLGFAGVAGRPSCTGGTRHLVALVRTVRPAVVAIVADADAPGVAGADRLAAALALYCREVRVATVPPGRKDLRRWVLDGATRADVNALIQDAPARRPTLRISRGR